MPSANRHCECGGAAARGASRPRLAARDGFTLLELLLAMAVMVVLAASAMSNYTAAGRRDEFREGVDRFVTLLRALRSQAQVDGRRMRLEFQAPDVGGGASFLVSFEQRPVSEPGVFVVADEGAWLKFFETGRNVSPMVLESRLLGDDAVVAAAAGLVAADADHPLAPITFNPDGSCDSARLILASPSDKVASGVRVGIDGLMGEISTTRIPAVDMEAYRW